MRHLVACARRWHGRGWRHHVFTAADRLFSSRASGTLRAAELAAAQRALACLRGYLAHASGHTALRACVAAAVGGLPRRRGLERPLCGAAEHDGVLLNAAVDLQTGAAFLADRVEDFLAGLHTYSCVYMKHIEISYFGLFALGKALRLECPRNLWPLMCHLWPLMSQTLSSHAVGNCFDRVSHSGPC